MNKPKIIDPGEASAVPLAPGTAAGFQAASATIPFGLETWSGGEAAGFAVRNRLRASGRRTLAIYIPAGSRTR